MDCKIESLADTSAPGSPGGGEGVGPLGPERKGMGRREGERETIYRNRWWPRIGRIWASQRQARQRASESHGEISKSLLSYFLFLSGRERGLGWLGFWFWIVFFNANNASSFQRSGDWPGSERKRQWQKEKGWPNLGIFCRPGSEPMTHQSGLQSFYNFENLVRGIFIRRRTNSGFVASFESRHCGKVPWTESVFFLETFRDI